MLDRINGEVEEQLIKFNKLENESDGFRIETAWIGQFDVSEVASGYSASPRDVKTKDSLDNLSQDLSPKAPQSPRSIHGEMLKPLVI